MELAASLTTAQSAVTKQAALYSIVKKQNDIETGLLEMLMNTALSAPPPGQGNMLDITV